MRVKERRGEGQNGGRKNGCPILLCVELTSQDSFEETVSINYRIVCNNNCLFVPFLGGRVLVVLLLVSNLCSVGGSLLLLLLWIGHALCFQACRLVVHWSLPAKIRAPKWLDEGSEYLETFKLWMETISRAFELFGMFEVEKP